ncbi:SDR family NAD(P)-dependent oxidoreductase [Streptomyces armeniacus]|uniref:SDR family NAD(P)-dependent oxidoreductase n=1 Tax=Streptomyces armeniacus TaxID=83291 RepID=A0A345XXX3_9ACTN|nr:SDR family oxidoreductase [Streptomyces armeniacus]AXK36489.1 SDR family NAD(P)-dependent oxidoreductase [Streptomyces armeniacus]
MTAPPASRRAPAPREGALRGRTVIVTGAGTGIGRAAAHQFADEGADVLAVGRSEGPLKETADGRTGIRVLTADVAAQDGPATIVDAALQSAGRVDVLVNNAGITRPAKLGGIDPALAREQIATNLLGPLFLAQVAVEHMREGGVIVNVTSNPPQRGWPGNSVYGATKVGLDFLTHTWARELAPSGIRVVSVAPGPTETPVLLHAGYTPQQVEARRSTSGKAIPLGRMGTPDEIAWWIVNAARPEAAYLTGAVIRVDGGTSIC